MDERHQQRMERTDNLNLVRVANIIWHHKFFNEIPLSNEVLYYEDVVDEEKYAFLSPLYHTVIAEACQL